MKDSLEKDPLAMDGAGLNALWREMAKNKAKYGHPDGAPFAEAFYARAKNYPVGAWREADREIVYRMLMWIGDLDDDILGNLDCSGFGEGDWAELLWTNPQILQNPRFPVDAVHPVDVLHAIRVDMENVKNMDDKSFVEDLLPEDEKEFTWFREDVERARQLGKKHFAAWLERIARD